MNRALLPMSREFLHEMGIELEGGDFTTIPQRLLLPAEWSPVGFILDMPYGGICLVVKGPDFPSGEPRIVLLEYETTPDGPKLKGWHV